MKLFIAAILMLAGTLSSAQELVPLTPEWREHFASLTAFDMAIHDLKLGDFDKKYSNGNSYPALLVYKDKSVYEGAITFTGLADLCDPKRPLYIVNKNGVSSPQPKSKFTCFVFDRYLFKFSNPVFEKSPDALWGIVYFSGPIHAMKAFNITQSASGPMTFESHYTFKHTKLVMSDIMDFGFLGGFNKRMSKIVNDYAELAGKVLAEEPGYTKENRVKILKEYNDWVKVNQPDIYEQFVYPH